MHLFTSSYISISENIRAANIDEQEDELKEFLDWYKLTALYDVLNSQKMVCGQVFELTSEDLIAMKIPRGHVKTFDTVKKSRKARGMKKVSNGAN